MSEDESVHPVPEEEAAVAHEIRRCRVAAGLSKTNLALMVRYSREYVSRAERPALGLPSAELVARIDAALEAGGRIVELRARAEQARRRRRHGALPVGEAVEVPDDTGRAHSLAPSPRQGSTDDVPVIVSVLGSSKAREAIDRFVGQVVARYEIEGPRLLYPEVLAARSLCVRLGDQIAGDQERAALAGTAGRLSGLLSYMCVNTADYRAAEEFANEANIMAAAADDRELSAWVGGTRSFAAYYRGDYAVALQFAESALDMAGPRSRQRARILSNGVARAAGKLGDVTRVERAVGEALDSVELEDEPNVMTPCISFESYGSMRTKANAATAFLSVKQTERVLALTDELNEKLSASTSRWSRSLVGLDAAMALADSEPDRSAALGVAAITESSEVPITSIQRRSGELSVRLQQFRANPVVGQYLEMRREWASRA